MTVCNLRLLLVAAIFISNCITWTASRHHYNHSISGHRIRHRRQGAGQFLSASYVLPGGEGSGWGDWGEVSPCSRTCGGGVASQKRICLQIGPDGTPYCTGGNTKYFTCQTQDCPDVNEDFRAQQCSEFDNKDFRGYKYKWIPYTHVPNPCELTCMPQGERFYYRHKDKVIDGTRCDEDSFNVCVNGQCQPVGCDLMLGSKAVEDKCRVCRGNGESCRTYAEIFDRQDLTQGYTDILLIPEGSTSILIEEIAPSRNYLALRAKDGDYYLNGHYHIDFPRSIVIAGALWNYERSPQGFMAPDRLRTLGPTTEPLYLSLLLQEKNVGIKYEYSVPNTTAPPTDKQYNWVHEEFSPCSHKCGGGIQTRNVTCRSREELEIVDDSLCDDGLKPAVNNICNPDPCPAQWVEGPWGNCSKRCGEGGVRSRVIRCEQIVANGHPSSIIDDNECLKALGPKPDLFEKCNENLACPTWFVGRWKPCDRLCDEGQQTRQVVCHQKVNGRVSLLDDEDCVDEKPETEKSCFLYPCEGVDWVTSKWIGCDSCLSTNRTRTVVCATRQRELVNDSFCSQHNKPVAEESCDPEKLPECEVQWYATQWSKCSVECGEGRQARKVFCGFFDGEAVQKVNDSKCAGQPRYNDTKVCVIPPEQCTMQWFAGPWEKCSKDCDGGEQSRILMCFRGDQQGTGCDKNTMPETARTCNTQPCNEDTLLPISPSAPSITNQLPYCDDEDYPEVGLESELSTTMQADHPTKPSFAEFEVDLGSGSGSGMGSPEPWIPLDSEEGSGFIFNDTDDTTDANNSTDTTTTSSTDSDTNATTTESIIDENNTTTVKPGVSATARPTNPAYRGDIDYDEENATSTINPTTDNENITSDDIKTTTDASNITTGTETDANATDITTAATTLESNTTTESDDANTTMPTPTTSDNLNLTLEAESNVTEATTEPDATGTPLANETTVTESSGVTNTNEIITTTEPSTVHNTSAKSGIPQTTRAPNPAYRGDDVEEVDAHTTTDANTGSTPIGSDDTNATTIIPTTYEDENTTATTPTTSEDANATTAIPTTYEDANATTEANASATTPATSEDANATTAIPTTYEDANATTEANATATTPTTLEDTNATTAIPTTYEDTNATTDANATATTPTTSEDTNATTATPTTYEDTNATTEANATATTPTTSEDANATTAIPTTYEDTNTTATTPTTSEDANATTAIPTTYEDANATTEANASATTPATSEDANATTAIPTTYEDANATTEANATATTPTTLEDTNATTAIPTTYEDTNATTDANATATTPTTSEDANATTAIPTTYEDANATTETNVNATTPTTSEDTNATTAIPTTYEDTNATTEANATATTPTTSEDANATTAIPTTYEDTNATTEANATATTPTTSEDANATTAIPTTYEDTNATATTPTTSEDANATTAIPTTYEDTNATTDANATATTPTTSEDANATTAIPTTYEDTNATATTPTTSEDANATTAIPTTYEDTNATATTPTTSEDANATTAIPTTYEDTNATATTPTTSEGANVTTSLPTTFDDTNTTVDYSTTATSNEATTEMSTSFTKATVWVFTTPQRQCIPRPRKCKKTTFGCCPDGKTAASGPFDQGCRRLKTCNETEHGCCPDGVSVASGPNEEGCPTYPCADTLFGCCLSNNKIAAEGNDQEGCPPLCVASEFGCCADNETEATGPEKQGCPESSTTESTTFTTESTTIYTTESTTEFTTESETWTTEGSTTETTALTTALDGCAVSQFGCCYDNETAASGPNAAGCPCNATEFGCCPDGVLAADGVGQEGCDGNCSLTKYGCCSDGQTPAHGPDFEGCCLTFTYGCCPDNLTPALGPHSEGCECKYSSYGCCPDNVTAAEGPNNQGCGCQYTTYGCCPDRRAAASGTDFEGCSCTTFQFGCCPDGVTHAIGPGQQGCQCQYSQYGCCGDEQTPATGPGGAGCDCTSSKFGCCVDGVTAASGPKFLGCVDVPRNPQGVCSLGTDPGPCHDFVAYWYYDLQYGGCSRFWYGGCEGNGNRFATQDECEDVCVRPAPKDACKLPGVAGPCEGDHVRWYYNSTHEQCTPFRYGGCLGNANNFDTREVCQSHCEPERLADKCSLSIEEGPCAGNYTRWGFDKDTGSCEQFTWGGCEGNANRFSTEAACLAHCRPPGTIAPQCTEPPREAGNCSDKQALWSFSTEDNRCLPFYYTGCDGNKNRFDSRQGCEALCPSSYEPDKCTLPADSGDCSNYREKWFYDTTNKRCRLFYYGGCGGNENNFESEVECENTCSEAAAFFTTTTTTTTVRPLLPTAAPTPQPAPSSSDICLLEIDSGPCTNVQIRWGYDNEHGKCLAFQYGGCGGNQNNFDSEDDCNRYCPPAQDLCQLPMQAGPCYASLTRWFYDAASDSCSQFAYGGCQGNENRFETRAECENRCKQSAGTTPASLPGPAETVNEVCTTPRSLAPCGENMTTYYYDTATRQCESGLFGGCQYPNSFSSPEECERKCGEFSAYTRVQICTARLDPGPCRALFPKFYWDPALGKCDEFAYGGCSGGPNRFDTLDECEDFCGDLAPEPSCLQTLDRGRYCDQPSSRRFYYSETRGECLAFVYLGCDGNENNFRTFDECANACEVIRPSEGSNEVPDCVAYDAECRSLQCANGVVRVPVEDGCERCTCAAPPVNCDSSRQACEALDCTFGIVKTPENGCETCRCAENPCVAQNCGPQEQCMTERIIDSTTQDIIYTARCVPDDNAIAYDCGAYQEECQRLVCPYGVQTSRLANGCERCSCITTETNCDMLTEECDKLRCTYGVDRTTDNDGCVRCSCSLDPCQSSTCLEDQRCVRISYRDPFTQETRYSAECRAVNKPGFCPAEESTNEDCRVECNDDADCRGVSKCCQVGCTRACRVPVEATLPPLTTTYAPDVPRAPEAIAQQEPEVSAAEGGKATLRCVFHGNPPPKITWTYGEVTIDGDQDRYRLLSDGSLEIVSLYRTDSGVYICVADNGLGIARQSITLIVKDPVTTSAGISGDENAAITGELGYPLEVRCLAYGYPPPMVSWTRESDGSMIPFNNAVYRARGNVLLIRRLDLHALGHYTCEAYNGVGVPASWRVAVQAFTPKNYVGQNEYLVPRDLIAPITAVITPEVTRETTTTTSTTTTTEPPSIPVFRVPVSTHITPLRGPLTAGQDLQLTCEVDGYPDPEIYWTKDGARIQSDDRISLSGSVSVSRLTVSRVSPDDAGLYGCHADNQYSSYTDSVQVNIKRGLVVPAKCTDNPFFANCDLIVHSNFCKHKYYSKFCCKSCVEAGQLDPEDAAMQADQPFRRK